MRSEYWSEEVGDEDEFAKAEGERDILAALLFPKKKEKHLGNV